MIKRTNFSTRVNIGRVFLSINTPVGRDLYSQLAPHLGIRKSTRNIKAIHFGKWLTIGIG